MMTSETHDVIYGMMKGSIPLPTEPLFQTIVLEEDKNKFVWNDTDHFSKIMKIGTAYTNRVADGIYKLEIKNTTNVPLYYWMVKNDGAVPGVGIGKMAPGQTAVVPDLQGLYFLKVARDATDTTPVQNGDYGVRVSEKSLEWLIVKNVNYFSGQGNGAPISSICSGYVQNSVTIENWSSTPRTVDYFMLLKVKPDSSVVYMVRKTETIPAYTWQARYPAHLVN